MYTKKNIKYLNTAMVFVTVASLAVALPAFAQTTPVTNQPAQAEKHGQRGMGGEGMGMRRGIRGNVTSISGTTLTITSTNPKDSTTKIYTVDASNAKVNKDGASSSVSAIAVGDTVMVAGPINGTNVTASNIFDGKMNLNRQPRPEGQGQPENFTGNGQPVVGGKVTSINGAIISITNRGNVNYTVDATNAKINKQGIASSTISNISVGDTIIAQGVVNGTSITASSIDDRPTPPVQQNVTNNGTTNTGAPQQQPGFFGRVKNFFSRFF